MKTRRVIVIGAGMGGLSAALKLSRQGFDVTVLERASYPGGKMRLADIEGHAIDTGPTVLTMRWVFDQIFHEAGTSLEAELTLTPLEVLARHAWTERQRLDLYRDRARSADAIASFSDRKNADVIFSFAHAQASSIALSKHVSFARLSRRRFRSRCPQASRA